MYCTSGPHSDVCFFSVWILVISASFYSPWGWVGRLRGQTPEWWSSPPPSGRRGVDLLRFPRSQNTKQASKQVARLSVVCSLAVQQCSGGGIQSGPASSSVPTAVGGEASGDPGDAFPCRAFFIAAGCWTPSLPPGGRSLGFFCFPPPEEKKNWRGSQLFLGSHSNSFKLDYL